MKPLPQKIKCTHNMIAKGTGEKDFTCVNCGAISNPPKGRKIKPPEKSAIPTKHYSAKDISMISLAREEERMRIVGEINKTLFMTDKEGNRYYTGFQSAWNQALQAVRDIILKGQ